MLSKSHPIILFIDRNGFGIYQDTLANIPKFNFTPDLVSSLDVVNKEQFVNLIATFIQINKIIGSSLAVILSDDVIYIKDLANDDKDHEDEVQNFLENIPFEEVLAKVIKIGSANRIVAVNKELVMTIIEAFTGKGSSIETVTPGFMYGQSANFTMGLTPDNVRVILGNTETLRLGNLLTDQEKITPFQNLESELKNISSDTKPDLASSAKKPKNSRQYILAGVFIALLAILGIVYFTLGSSQTVPKSYKIKNTPASATNVPTALPENLNIISPVDLKSIKIKITESSQTATQAASLKNELLKIGFADITNEVSQASVPEKSSVIFSQNIPADLRDNIVAEIKKILQDISVLESQDSNFTIDILIGKS